MGSQLAMEEYISALKQGQKEVRDAQAERKPLHPLVLDDILQDNNDLIVQDIGTLEIPTERVVGVKSAGRITAFSATFLPLLGYDSEFAIKWVSLCQAHLSETGLRDPILCYEYLGNFYIQEGNKRYSVLRWFGAPRVPSQVKRILPPMSNEPRIKAYYEFLEFYKSTKLYCVQFRRPGDYAKLLGYLGKEPDIRWTEDERRTFSAYFHYFCDAFKALSVKPVDVLPEEALLIWLQLYPYSDLGALTATELKKTLSALWTDVITGSLDSVNMHTKPEEDAKGNILTRLITTTPDHLNVAFVHQLDAAASTWVLGHEDGRKHIESVFGSRVTVRSYYHAKTTDLAEALLEQAVSEGAQVVFTTAPLLRRATLKVAVKYPKVRFLNCSVDQPYASIRSYYGRIYEAKFITGAIAGAMAQENRIGYIASYPIFGVPASINAFALGAQLTNPRAQIELRWSCCEGTHQADFFRDGIRVVSNRDIPTQDKQYMDFCNYGTYLMDDRGGLVPLGSPVWVWGKFYEFVLRSIFSGTWKDQKDASGAVNYWLGMDSGAIGIRFSEKLPTGVRCLAELLRKDLCSGTLDLFFRRIIAQDGSLKNDGTKHFTSDEVLHMDWLCDNVDGSIPGFDQIIPISQPTVRELGVYRDTLPGVKEVASVENIDRIR